MPTGHACSTYFPHIATVRVGRPHLPAPTVLPTPWLILCKAIASSRRVMTNRHYFYAHKKIVGMVFEETKRHCTEIDKRNQLKGKKKEGKKTKRRRLKCKCLQKSHPEKKKKKQIKWDTHEKQNLHSRVPHSLPIYTQLQTALPRLNPPTPFRSCTPSLPTNRSRLPT